MTEHTDTPTAEQVAAIREQRAQIKALIAEMLECQDAMRTARQKRKNANIDKHLDRYYKAMDALDKVDFSDPGAAMDTLLEALAADTQRIAGLEARKAELETRWEQLHADDFAILQHATVYDYNRHGVVAFQQEGLDAAKFKALADTRQECVVYVFLSHDAAVALAQQALAPAPGSDTAGAITGGC